MCAEIDAANQVVKITLDGVVFLLRIVGKTSGLSALGAIKLALGVGNQKWRKKAKVRFSTMAKKSRTLSVFSIPIEQIKAFKEETKKYGVMFCMVKNKSKKDNFVEVLCSEEDASKLNRIFEKLKVASVVVDDVINKDKSNIITENEKIIDAVVATPEIENPSFALTEKSNLSEHFSANTNKDNQKKSVKEDLAEIKTELKKAQNTAEKSKTKGNTKTKVKTKAKSKAKTKEISK